jgi:RecA-family ATPase
MNTNASNFQKIDHAFDDYVGFDALPNIQPNPPEFIPMHGDQARASKPTARLAPEATRYELPMGMLASDLFEREKTPSDFVLPGFIAGTVGALIAPGSTGKSMLAMQLAALVAGADMLGANWPKLKTGEVLILALEDPANELYNRWTDLGSKMSSEEKKAGRRVRVVPMIGLGFDIMNDEHFNALVRACTGKRLLILDTMRRIHMLNENDGGEMARVVARLEELAALTGCAILFLHHTNKAATFNGAGDQQQASRGSSVLVDNIRFQMFMVGMNKGDDESKEVKDAELFSQFVRVGVSKVNYGSRIGDIWLHRAEGGILESAGFPTSALTSLVISEHRKNKAKEAKNEKNEKKDWI